MKKNQKKTSGIRGELKRLNSIMKEVSPDDKLVVSDAEKKRKTLQKKRAKRNLTYISWLDNERRLRNLTTP